ncbi:(Fe-S)-binding protein [Breoghania sp.]|uniref:(Fe-S)-binding protein n=1 Tax=Breoghania sp. TaxID=2065378 RepID=UPI002AA9564B|nr:(Fe-S)-binding protein [Breoghania sp.]
MAAAFASFGLLIILIAAAGFALHASRRWRAGAGAHVDIIAGLKALPGRYLRDVHDVVARKPFNARFHALTAGGFLGALGLVSLAAVPGIGGPWLWGLAAVLLAAMTGGAAMVGWRRRVQRPDELSGGRFARLPLSLLAFSLGFLVVALDAAFGGVLSEPVSLILASIGLLGTADLLLGVGRGPLKHALNGALHLIAHPRPLRFSDHGGERQSALLPLDLEAEKFGAEVPRDFAWNRLLGFEACVQCGRCETLCPAYAAGLPLNPKAFIQDIAGALSHGASGYAGNDHPGERFVGESGPDLTLVGEGAAIHPDTLWACTTCRACVEACPMMIEHVDAVVDLRRFQTLELGAAPGKAADVLEALRHADNPGGLEAARRIDWASDLALPLAASREHFDVLLWLGDAAFDLRGQRSLRALIRLLRLAEVDFAVLGADELDCGDLARRLGDEATFQGLATRTVAQLAGLDFNRIVTMDPHALHALRNEYPAFGLNRPVLHHTAFLAELVDSGRLTLKALSGTVTYHDPCYLGRYNGETEAPRRLLDALGLERREMEFSGLFSRCCGGGGGATVTDIEGEFRIADQRMDQARATGAECVAVACPNCTAMLEGVVEPRPEVREIAELVLEAAT